jgi:hypothetical protein
MAMRLPINLVLAALVSICLGSTARADLIDWTMSGVAFNDGGTLSGTFRVDTVLHQVTTWDVTTTAGTLLPGFHFTSTLPNNNFSNYDVNIIDVTDAATSNEFELTFNSSLGTASANNTIFPAGTFEYDSASGNSRSVTSGAADGTLVTSPGPLAGGGLLSYLIVGFGGLAAYRRRALAWAKLTVATGRTRLRRRHGVVCSPA